MAEYKILVLNPGSTSLKFAVYEDDQAVLNKTIRFTSEQLKEIADPDVRVALSTQLIVDALKEQNLSPADFDCVISRGGVLGKVETGAYAINDKMVDFVLHSPARTHSVGVLIAHSMTKGTGKPCYIYDAVTADEWDPICKVSGIKGYSKPAQQHTLNTRQVARQVAEDMGKTFETANIIVSHLGGGIDTTFFRNGHIVETIGYNELGFSTDRCGAVHYNDLLKMTKNTPTSELQPLNRGKGGLMSHLGTASVEDAEKMIDNGDEYAALVLEAMAYRVAQCIGAGAVALEGKVDAIVLTGGIAYSKRFTDWIISRVSFLSKVVLLPGELETQALASGALRVLRGEEIAKTF